MTEDYLETKGRLRKLVADKYQGHNEPFTLKCKDHKDPITCICLSSDGQFLFSGSKDGSMVKCECTNKLNTCIISHENVWINKN